MSTAELGIDLNKLEKEYRKRAERKYNEKMATIAYKGRQVYVDQEDIGQFFDEAKRNNVRTKIVGSWETLIRLIAENKTQPNTIYVIRHGGAGLSTYPEGDKAIFFLHHTWRKMYKPSKRKIFEEAGKLRRKLNY